MTITVNGPGGVVVNFPDGTDATTIDSVMSHAIDGAGPAPKADAGRPMDYGVMDIARAVGDGIPIVGGLLKKAYSPETNARVETFDKEHPYISGAAGVAGSIGSLAIPLSLPGRVGAGAAKVLGMTGDSLMAAARNSALSGGVIGGLDAASRGQDIKGGAELGAGLGALGPVAGRAIGSAINGARGVLSPINRTPSNALDVAGVRVPLDRGQAAGDVILQREIDQAGKGALGSGARDEVAGFRMGQDAAVDQANAAVKTGIGNGAIRADDPYAAAEIAQQGLQREAAAAKGAATAKYDEFAGLDGNVHAGAFENIGQRIKGDLSGAQAPVIISEKTTPAASQMIDHIDNGIGRLHIQNKADPFGAPNPENVVGVSLKGVDQARKELLSIARGASNDADRRAAKAIISSFDERLQGAVNSHLYSGDPAAFQALKDARGLWANYSKTFKANDVVEQMIGKNGQAPSHSDIANWMYGASGLGGSTKAVEVANKLQAIFGPNSPEWQAIRQGMFARLTEGAEARLGAQKANTRISEFLNGQGKQLAGVLFDPKSRALISQYGELMKRLTPLPGAVNHSGTSYGLSTLMQTTLAGLASMAGLEAGGPVGGALAIGGAALGKGAMNKYQAKRAAANLYGSASQRAMARPLLNTQAGGALLSRAAIGF